MPKKETVKINAQVDPRTRDSLRVLADQHGSTVQNVTRTLIDLGFEAIMAMPRARRGELIPRDGRRKQSEQN